MGNHLWTNIGHRKTRRCRGTVKKFAAKLFFQFDLRAYPGLGAVQPIAGIAEAFFLKNAVEGWSAAARWISPLQKPILISINRVDTECQWAIEGTTDGAFRAGFLKTTRPVKHPRRYSLGRGREGRRHRHSTVDMGGYQTMNTTSSRERSHDVTRRRGGIQFYLDRQKDL